MQSIEGKVQSPMALLAPPTRISKEYQHMQPGGPHSLADLAECNLPHKPGD